jgi:ATPases with chaperone activity, ATP-binding subunit
VQILRGLRDRYEAHHRVKITDEALKAAASSPTATSRTATCPTRRST